MIRFAALIAHGAPSAAALAAFPEEEAARRLLSGQRPRRLAPAATLLDWAAEAAATPEFLVKACLAVSADKAEVAALLLPPATGDSPGLAQVLATLDALQSAPLPERRAAWLAMARSLPPPARLVLNRLASGTFRLGLKPDAPPEGGPRTFRAALTMIAPQGPEGSFALRHGNGLVPIARLPLTLAETPEILAWARQHILQRFGPNLAVTPDLVFTLSCTGTIANRRRKSGLDLADPRILAWDQGASLDQVTTLDDFRTPGFILV